LNREEACKSSITRRGSFFRALRNPNNQFQHRKRSGECWNKTKGSAPWQK
jgi:hypothetical protein